MGVAPASLRGGDYSTNALKRIERETAKLIGAVAQDGASRAQLVARSGGKTEEQVLSDAAMMLQMMRQMAEMKDMMSALLAERAAADRSTAAESTVADADALVGAIDKMSKKMDATAAEVKLIGTDVRYGFGYTTWADMFSKRTLGLVLKSPLLMAGRALRVYLAPQNALVQYLSKPFLLALGAVQLAVHVIALAYGASYLFAAFPALGQFATDALGHLGSLLRWVDGLYGSVLSAAGADFYNYITSLLLSFKNAAVDKLHALLMPALDAITSTLKAYIADLVGAASKSALSTVTLGYFGGGGGGGGGAAYFGMVVAPLAGAYKRGREQRLVREQRLALPHHRPARGAAR
jgi:hypothetical protein